MDRLEHEVDQLIDSPLPDNAVDIAGRLGHVIGKLSAYKRALLSEVTEPTDGKEYRAAFSRSAKRSYNTAAILKSFDDAGVDLKALRAADVVRLQWRWTELKAEAYKAGVTLSIAPRELGDDGDLDEPMIGEVWEDSIRLEGKK